MQSDSEPLQAHRGASRCIRGMSSSCMISKHIQSPGRFACGNLGHEHETCDIPGCAQLVIQSQRRDRSREARSAGHTERSTKLPTVTSGSRCSGDVSSSNDLATDYPKHAEICRFFPTQRSYSRPAQRDSQTDATGFTVTIIRTRKYRSLPSKTVVDSHRDATDPWAPPHAARSLREARAARRDRLR